MIINFHFMQYFLLEHDDFVTFSIEYYDYGSKFCGKIITSLP